MTTEIAILNKSAVALAADSAVTVTSSRDGSVPKIWSSAHKLFSLSKHAPVGVMIYGNVEFMGIPWEVLIKEFRSSLGSTKHPTLKDYVDSLFSFLSKLPVSDQAKDKYILEPAHFFFDKIRQQHKKEVKNSINANGEISNNDAILCLKQIYQSRFGFQVIHPHNQWQDGTLHVVSY